MLQISRAVSRDDHWIREVERFTRRLELTLSSAPPGHPVDLGEVLATDRTTSVTCAVDGRGDFLDVRVDDEWWDTLGPSGIGPAILDALQLAQEKAMLGALVLRRHHRGAPARTPVGSSSAGARSSQPPGELGAEWSAAKATVERTHVLMAGADRMAELRDTARPRTIKGISGVFRLRLVGFTVVGCDVDVDPFIPTDAEVVADSARSALRQATREREPTYWLTVGGVPR